MNRDPRDSRWVMDRAAHPLYGLALGLYRVADGARWAAGHVHRLAGAVRGTPIRRDWRRRERARERRESGQVGVWP